VFSLRTRLTIAYAVLIGVLFAIVGFFAARFAADYMLRPVFEDLESSANAVRAVSAEYPLASATELQSRLPKQDLHPEIDIRFYPMASPHLSDRRPLSLAIFLGLRRVRIMTHSGPVDVVVNVAKLTPQFLLLEEICAAILFGIMILSILLARMISNEAIRPLEMVTKELRRFAAGDFSTGAVAEIDRDEFGELTAAYNAAAARVTEAFEEHVRVEEQMKRFVADASHELRTPLTVISGYLDILKKMDPNDVVAHERAFRTLNIETKRVRLLVDRLVALARLERTERAHREVLDMRTVANEVITEVSAAREIAIDLRVGEDFSIVADLADVYDAIRNLVENAVKYGQGAQVIVEVFLEDAFGCVRVRDRGPGIPEHERSHLFERFFRGELRANIEGSGLGLSIVARAMQRSNGMVVLESAEPADTSFLLRFPLER
jgi:two-component system OmpR family sensor kinase